MKSQCAPAHDLSSENLLKVASKYVILCLFMILYSTFEFVKHKKIKLGNFFLSSLFRKPVEKTHKNPYPHVESMGFVRVQILLPGPVPQRTLPVTPTGFDTRDIP